MSCISEFDRTEASTAARKLPCMNIWCEEARDEHDEEETVSYDLSDTINMLLEEGPLNLPGVPNTLMVGSKRYVRTEILHRTDDILPIEWNNWISAVEVHMYELSKEAQELPPVPTAERWSGTPVVDYPHLPLPEIGLDRISLIRPYDKLVLKFTAGFCARYDGKSRLHRACHMDVIQSMHEGIQNARAIDLCTRDGQRCDKTFTPIRVPQIRPDVPLRTVNDFACPTDDNRALQDRYLFCAAVMPGYDLTLNEYVALVKLSAEDSLHLVIAIVELVACVRELGHTYLDMKTVNIGVWCNREGDLTLTLIDLDDIDKGPCTFAHYSVPFEDAADTPITDRNFMWAVAACICEVITNGREDCLYYNESGQTRKDCMRSIIEHLYMSSTGPFSEQYGKITGDLLVELTSESSELCSGSANVVDVLRRQAATLREALSSNPPTGKRLRPSFPVTVALRSTRGPVP
ncbi:hypothetical protein CYMTET_41526 [Cymbomonas tetramitiformis]|uniref:Protein kinase domain-containing protein n=1 Tax=Cymbomonas tetramitiformis TaxID=36881 RepID=A0AAE0C608_9CHLO|nr:hypothetical protein CYMTET_46798 [Cymbomonas tetramitiformis]KAK3249047.1 hypothetical protein CYMTET_41526 [Cymbomonas tetramitiformis]